MTALAKDRNTPSKLAQLIAREIPVADTTTVYAGSLGAVDTAGKLVPAAATAGLRVQGRVVDQVVNPASGALKGKVEKGIFRWGNAASHLVTVAMIGAPCYVEDDQTVSCDQALQICAGIVVNVDADGVWVDTDPDSMPQNGGTETKTSGAASVYIARTVVSVTGTVAFTLAAGTRPGQRKHFQCTTAASTPHGTLTPAAVVGYATIEFNLTTHFAILEWTGAAWAIVATNAVIA